MATKRKGKAYVWATWLAKLLGGNECVWSAWFKAHYRYEKHEEQAADLAEWNREHNRLMKARRAALERDGWKCYVEDENAFQLEGASAILAGKADLVAVKGDRVLIVDGKTGRERESDIWQVLLYLFALPRSRPDLPKNLEGEVHYKHVDVAITPEELDEARITRIADLMKAIGSDQPPAKKPSRDECKRCNIGPLDCPERVGAPKPTKVAEF